MVTNPLKVNLKRTQPGYVPLEDRFNSMDPDSKNTPESDADFYFNNYANQTLEHATISLLYPTPKWLRAKLRPKPTEQLPNCLVTTDDEVILMDDGSCLVMNPGVPTCLETSEGVLVMDDGKCLSMATTEQEIVNCLEVDGKILTIDGKCLALSNGGPCLETSEGVLLIDGKCLEMA